MNLKKLLTLFVFFLAVNVLCLPTFAQGGSAVVSGTVTDPTGAAVPQAHVTLINVDTNLSLNAESNNSGLYRFPTVPPGHYTLATEVQASRSSSSPASPSRSASRPRSI